MARLSSQTVFHVSRETIAILPRTSITKYPRRATPAADPTKKAGDSDLKHVFCVPPRVFPPQQHARMTSLAPLRALLQRRLDLIADHAFRERDAAAHLAALQQVSEELIATHVKLRAELPPRLNHFLSQASFSKALEYLDSSTE